MLSNFGSYLVSTNDQHSELSCASVSVSSLRLKDPLIYLGRGKEVTLSADNDYIMMSKVQVEFALICANLFRSVPGNLYCAHWKCLSVFSLKEPQ